MNKQNTNGRKLDIDFKVYNPRKIYVRHEVKGCDHDYDPTPIKDEDDYGTWKCTRCGMELTLEVYD
jgi:hypothetical protein